MATPLLDILQDVFLNRASVTEDLLRENGYEDLDGADIQEAILAVAETLPVTESANLTEVADGLDPNEGSIEDAVNALQEAQDAYAELLEAQGDLTDMDLADTDVEAETQTDEGSDGDVDIQIEASGADVDIDIDTGDSDARVEVAIEGDENPEVDIEASELSEIMVSVDGDEVTFEHDYDAIDGEPVLGNLAEPEPVIEAEDSGLDFDLD